VPEAFSPDNSALYVASSIGVNAAQLLRYDLKTGQSSVVYADPIRPDFMVFINWPELPV